MIRDIEFEIFFGALLDAGDPLLAGVSSQAGLASFRPAPRRGFTIVRR